MTIKDFPNWNDGDILPTNELLKPSYVRDDYVVFSGRFLVFDGKTVSIWVFHRPPHPVGGYYPGYWQEGRVRQCLRWMILPLGDEPVHESN